uniref:Uncharacterized protein n=1 Tax=Rhizophora mucronata TaxID=61149 RepID=A0A2P2PEM1_RHIMU
MTSPNYHLSTVAFCPHHHQSHTFLSLRASYYSDAVRTSWSCLILVHIPAIPMSS